MSDRSRLLPQASAGVDAAMALVCSVPASSRRERRLSVRDVISQATRSSETETGVIFLFVNTEEIAQSLLDLVLAERNCCARFNYSIVFGAQRAPIELRVEAEAGFVQPLKDMYASLGHETASDAEDAVE